mmetsp:Transcript_118049/g.345720  ORF Transcript_118049/g.345720 Transcript_118049/m.345720 type:complete len:105 (-) Transcript_118049:320-634(-)
MGIAYHKEEKNSKEATKTLAKSRTAKKRRRPSLLHDTAPSSDQEVQEHCSQTVCPSSAAISPGLHSSQKLCPVMSCLEPRGHALHWVLLVASANLPTGHISQAV